MLYIFTKPHHIHLIFFCNSLEFFSGIFWNFLEFSGIFWNFLEFSGIFWNFSGKFPEKIKTFCISTQKVKNKVLSSHVYTVFMMPFFGIFDSSQKNSQKSWEERV